MTTNTILIQHLKVLIESKYCEKKKHSMIYNQQLMQTQVLKEMETMNGLWAYMMP